MTSYVDETQATKTTKTAASKEVATQNVDATMNAEQSTATSTKTEAEANTKTTTTTAFGSKNSHHHHNKKMSTPTTTTTTIDDTISCYDENSLSDGREKTDLTPENLKKIDEFINHPDEEIATPSTSSSSVDAESLLASTTTAAAATTAVDASHRPPLSPTSTARLAALNSSSLAVGLGVVIDESNAKICLAKKDTLSVKSSHKSNESNEPTTVVDASNDNCNSHHSDNRSSRKQLSISTPYAYADEEDDDSTSTATTTTTTGGKQQSLAFTIDNFNDKETNSAAQQARYKSIMQRIQSRHRRGASMSKLETDSNSSSNNAKESNNETTSPVSGRVASRQAQRENSEAATPTTEQPKVRMRVRDRSTSRVRDAAKRHSWSPRSSSSTTQELQQHHNNQQQQTQASSNTARVRSAASTTKPSRLPPPAATKGAANLVANRTQFMPRSTAMQLALQKVDFLCPEPPLADFKHSEMNADDAVSETGTYTLDGDNYTEEQKDYMNIDHSGLGSKQKVRPKDLAVKRGANTGRRPNNNVLEVSYYHETPLQEKPTQKSSSKHRTKTSNEASDLILGAHQTAGEYLEQIKSRVLRNMSSSMGANELKTQPKPSTTVDEDSEDVGCFTSVTTSGVLAKQRALDKHPKLARCTSLSTSQIDSSEYVSNEVKLKNANQLAAAGGFTDHQKAEYRLNVFSSSGSKEMKFAATRKLISSPPETPTNCTAPETLISETEVLKTAHTKEDWIQQWARNARARSLATESYKQQQLTAQELMTRSYTCAETGTSAAESLTDENIFSQQQQQYNAKLNKSLAERYRLMGAGDCDFTSDPALNAHATDLNFKPPKSPSKIPSPLHSLGRARSASRSRPSLQAQQMLLSECNSSGNPEDYLQKTAAVISNLQQSLSRKNSIKSPTHSSASPRSHGLHPPAHIYTPDECSPQHSLETASGSSYRRSPMHRRNFSHETNHSGGGPHSTRDLMTSSVNESQLHLLTSGEYMAYKMNKRKNSLDAIASPVSPQNHPYDNSQQHTPQDDGSMSPLRRSSSFSANKLQKQQHQQQQQQQQQQQGHVPNRRARPQFQNIYTPPAARHQYAFAAAPANADALVLKKSASSNNFGPYSDYDDNLQYYINDEDEGEYSSSGDEGDEFYDQQQQAADAGANAAAPVSNTRLNKVLLMRIERSKQRQQQQQQATGTGSGNSSKPNSAPPGGKPSGGIGNIACPNTPELPRRGIKSAQRPNAGPPPVTKCRQSMPRDTSLSRLANQVPSSLASAKKQLLQTAYGVPNAQSSKLNQRVQPKYMDISKYKSAQSNNFLRKNDSKSTLKSNGPPEYMKRSPSTSSIGMSRADPTRTSNRSARSVQSAMNSSTSSLTAQSARASSAVRRDASAMKQKEAEMAMWKRRSTYDPMKAAAEDRRRKEEARRLAQSSKPSLAADSVPFESARPANQTTITTSNYSPRNSMEPDNPDWMLGESSEYGEDEEEGDIVPVYEQEQLGDEDDHLNDDDDDLVNINEEEQYDDVFVDEPSKVGQEQ